MTTFFEYTKKLDWKSSPATRAIYEGLGFEMADRLRSSGAARGIQTLPQLQKWVGLRWPEWNMPKLALKILWADYLKGIDDADDREL